MSCLLIAEWGDFSWWETMGLVWAYTVQRSVCHKLLLSDRQFLHHHQIMCRARCWQKPRVSHWDYATPFLCPHFDSSGVRWWQESDCLMVRWRRELLLLCLATTQLSMSGVLGPSRLYDKGLPQSAQWRHPSAVCQTRWWVLSLSLWAPVCLAFICMCMLEQVCGFMKKPWT